MAGTASTETRQPDEVAEPLLAWYDRHARRLPWRIGPGESIGADPYRVWLSEIMLQQTTVTTVVPYFQAFMDRWPTVGELAAAPLDEILTAWAGLGYYARARNLHLCARTVERKMGGRFPQTEASLRTLPGIGPYTAAAVAAIAFDQPATPVDGNVERVVARAVQRIASDLRLALVAAAKAGRALIMSVLIRAPACRLFGGGLHHRGEQLGHPIDPLSVFGRLDLLPGRRPGPPKCLRKCTATPRRSNFASSYSP